MTVVLQTTERTVRRHPGATSYTVLTVRTVYHCTLAGYSQQRSADAALHSKNSSWFYLNGLHLANGTPHPDAQQRFDDLCKRYAERNEQT